MKTSGLMLPASPSHAPTRVPASLPQRAPGERDGNREEQRHLSEPEGAGQRGAVEDECGGDAGDERRPAGAQRANDDRCRHAAGGEAGELPHEQGWPQVDAGEREHEEMKLRRVEVDRFGEPRRAEHAQAARVHRLPIQPAVHRRMEKGEVGPNHLTFEARNGQADERPKRHCAESYEGRDPYRAVQVLRRLVAVARRFSTV